MTLDLHDCTLAGPAITTDFLCDGLARVVDLQTGIDAGWDRIRDSLRAGGMQRVHQQVTTKLATVFGYRRPLRQDPIITREGPEDGGWLLQAPDGPSLRAWSIQSDVDLDGPDPGTRRQSPTRAAQRVLLARNEQAGLLINGDIIRLLLCDPSRADSHLSIDTSTWPKAPLPPDSFRVLHALTAAASLPNLPHILQAARLQHVRVTTDLRRQTKEAIVGFINALPARTGLDPATLWHESLILVYRLLFILKLENPAQPGDGFSFASTRLWRESLSPNRSLGALVRRHLDHGHHTGHMLEHGLRALFGFFRDGLHCSELRIAALGGGLFGPDSTPLLDHLPWGEPAVALLLDRLIWLVSARGERARVHYGALDVEDLGSIYEELLEQLPCIATEPMIRVRQAGMETVVPAGDRPADIEPGQFFLRNGPGRKSSGSFYTPHAFVRFLVRETLDPKIAALSPFDDPHPARLLTLRIVDPATGSGHFLVEACRHLAEALLSACLRCDERGLHQRIAALPDPDQTIAAYLPSRGYSEARARSICRRLVAVHCLYGCDRNKLAVELAKLSLWLESYAEGLPLTFLDHRLVHGDALTSPFFPALSTLPVTGGALDPLLADGVTTRLDASLRLARELVAQLDASIGRDLADLTAKQSAKDRLDRLLHPLRALAQAWVGAVMLHERDCDDVWLALARHVAAHGCLPAVPGPRAAALLAAGADSVAWDLLFPEVFPHGFCVVLGNPPWDVLLPNTREFVAGIDPAILLAKTRSAQTAIEQSVLARPGVGAAFAAYRATFDQMKRIAVRHYRHQRTQSRGETTGGSLDLFRLFAERNMALSSPNAAIGVLLPSAFHANEGSTGIRRLYLQQSDLTWCLSFENRRHIFPIDSRFKFDLIVARRPGPTESFQCGFYLDRIEDASDPARIMTYDLAFLNQTGGASLTPLELRGTPDRLIAATLFAQPERLGAWCRQRQIQFGCDLHMTADARCFRPAGTADLVLHEGKTFHQYTDTWHTSPRYSVASETIKPATVKAAGHVRLAFRDIARSNDERTMIAFMAPPGVVFGHTATVERAPWSRETADALVLCVVFNSFTFDWLVRQKAATHLSLYLLNDLPVPGLTQGVRRILAAGALRLSCPPADDDRQHRALLRAQLDAAIARAYGLDRQQYQHLLSRFSHRTWPDAAALCLEAFDGPDRR